MQDYISNQKNIICIFRYPRPLSTNGNETAFFFTKDKHDNKSSEGGTSLKTSVFCISFIELVCFNCFRKLVYFLFQHVQLEHGGVRVIQRL